MQKLLQEVEVCPVIRQQKLKLYKLGICPTGPSLSSNLMDWRSSGDHSNSLPEKMDRLAKPANPNLLYLTKKEGGLELPSLSGLYKQLQASRQCQLLT